MPGQRRGGGHQRNREQLRPNVLRDRDCGAQELLGGIAQGPAGVEQEPTEWAVGGIMGRRRSQGHE